MPHQHDTYRTHGIDLRTSQGSFSYSAEAWKSLPIAAQAAFNALSVRMQQAGLAGRGKHFTGATLFMQMNRAVRSVYGYRDWANVPAVPAPPPAPPQFTVSAAGDDTRTVVTLNAPAFNVGCQVWLSKLFVPGCRDPFAQRVTLRGALSEGWPDGGVVLNGILDDPQRGQFFGAAAGMAFVVKVVPVSPEGFVGPSLSEVCVVE